MPKNLVRVIIPDSHGEHIDIPTRDAFCEDLKKLCPDEIIGIGDHLDCGGTFSTHQRSYTNELAESYDDDCRAANIFLDMCQRRAPKAAWHYLEGNHEARVERWAARTFPSHKDAVKVLGAIGPEKALKLRDRGIRYYKRSEIYHGLSIPGCIRLGKCCFVHGISHSKNAADVHLARFGTNVVFGHTHTAQFKSTRTVMSEGFAAWGLGTFAKLQPLYKHTEPSTWGHVYGVQFVNKSGIFIHVNVPIHKGRSLLLDVASRLA